MRLFNETSQGLCRMWLAGGYRLPGIEKPTVCRIIQKVDLGCPVPDNSIPATN